MLDQSRQAAELDRRIERNLPDRTHPTPSLHRMFHGIPANSNNRRCSITLNKTSTHPMVSRRPSMRTGPLEHHLASETHALRLHNYPRNIVNPRSRQRGILPRRPLR